IADAGDMARVEGPADDGIGANADAALARIRLGAPVTVVARRPREQRAGAVHRRPGRDRARVAIAGIARGGAADAVRAVAAHALEIRRARRAERDVHGPIAARRHRDSLPADVEKAAVLEQRRSAGPDLAFWNT